MTLAEAKKVFQPNFVVQLKEILINGNFGDFVTAKDNVAIVKYFVECNPNVEILISTNGSAMPKIWAELGKIRNVTIGFALDGLQNTHSRYRQNTDWCQVIQNAKSFIEAGGKAIWRMIKFDYNAHQVEECKALAKELKFERFELLYDGRDMGPVYTQLGQYDRSIGTSEIVLYPRRVEDWDEWKSKGMRPDVRKKQYLTIPIKSSVSCKSKNDAEIYVTATGEVYPCCWFGFYPKLEYKHSWQTDNFDIAAIAQNNNANEVSMEEAVAWFNAVEASWQKKAYSEGRLMKCDQYCGR